MQINFLNYLLAFFEGIALILSPCILPILPILLSGAITGGKKRPLGIILGFVLVFTLFTLFSRALVQSLHINLDILRDIAFLVIILFGIVMISNYLTAKFELFTQKIANISDNVSAAQTTGGFTSGLLLGSMLGFIWTPCAGPISAAILIQVAIQKTLFSSFLALICFSLGAAIPMLLIALSGRKLVTQFNFLKRHSMVLRKCFGIVIIVFTLLLAYISYFHPELFANLLVSRPRAAKTVALAPDVSQSSDLINGLASPYPAPEIAGITSWINSSPLSLAQLHGKVVLIDFWTYSCINCIRTIPYLLAWDQRYRDKGLVIIGIHTPEFEFEKNPANVKQAVQRFGIHYPVALDNQYATWMNFHNEYWPADYLIDRSGKVVFTLFGEGGENITEHNIRVLLGLNPQPETRFTNPTGNELQTPETYLGYARGASFSSPEQAEFDQIAQYTLPQDLPLHAWALGGAWRIEGEKITAAAANASIELHFAASHVYAVMGSAGAKQSKIRVLLNGQDISDANAGKDVINSMLQVTDQRLYEIAKFPRASQGKITLIILDPGIEVYTFTFG